MVTLRLAIKSLLNRKTTVLLTVFSIALSVTLLLGVERVRTEARTSFTNTISGTDLIGGARGGSIQLLLYAVFRIGNATNNVAWSSYQDIVRDERIAWAVPISLGDSHRGFRVLGTTPEFFERYRYARTESVHFAQGAPFADLFDAVIGADVAAKLRYTLHQDIVLAHGAGAVNLTEHADKPFHVAGVLQATGTPVDRTVFVSLQGIEAIHADWFGGAPPRVGSGKSADAVRALALEPKTITAFLLGLKSKVQTFHLQRMINQYDGEPLTAILPGVALQELWDLMAVAENALLAVSVLVVLVGLTGMITVLLTSLQERRREMAILRSVGARPLHIFALILGESGTIAAAGAAAGVAFMYATLLALRPVLETRFGLHLPMSPLTVHELILLAATVAAGIVAGLIPSFRAYRYSVADGMMVRV